MPRHTNPAPPEKLLTPAEFADLTGLKRQTLRKMRMAGRGPTFVTLSARCVRYPESKVAEWIAARTVVPPASSTN